MNSYLSNWTQNSSIKEIEKASDIGIRRGQKEYPLASVNNEDI